MPDQPWYREGLQFECRGCGQCCTGEPGYVWVTQDEITELAKALAMSATDFENAYVRRVGNRKSLKEMPNGDCAFFDAQKRRCSVYGVRPRQCRTWPFWESNLQSPRTWRAVCEACPGSGQGRFVAMDKIQKLAAIVRL